VITIGVIDVGSNNAFLLGDIENLRGSTLDEAGFLVSTVQIDESEFRINNPDISKYLSAEQVAITENQAFAVSAGDLESGTSYFFRAYGLLGGEENPAYGEIDSFTTTGFNIAIQDFRREGTSCPTEASIQLKVDIRGVLPSSVEFGITWQHDLFSDPTVDGNIILADQIDAQGNATILMPVLCNEFYRVRPFIRSSVNQVFYNQAIELAEQPGGAWKYVGEIPQQFSRSEKIIFFSLEQKGYIIGFEKEGNGQSAFWQFDLKNQIWSKFKESPVGFANNMWMPSSTQRIFLASGSLLEYLPVFDRWESLGDFPFSLFGKTGFEFENKIYFLDDGNIGFVRLSDPSTFVPLEIFPGQTANISFRIEKNGYLGLLSTSPAVLSTELWQFNLQTESWKPVAEFPNRVFSQIVFSMNGKGYVLGGADEELKPHPGFWEYDPETDEWTRLADFGRGDGNADIGFAIEGSAYAGLGVSFDGVERQEFWKYVQELK